MTVTTVKTQWETVAVPSLTETASGRDAGMEVFFCHPDTSDRAYPAVVLLMEIFGINEHIQALAQRLASEGFAVAAINFYHRQTANLNLGYTEADVTQGRLFKDRTTRAELLADVQAAIGFLKAQPQVDAALPVATMGFCFGGHVGFLAGALPEVQKTVVCYGAGLPVMCPGEGQPSLAYANDIHGELLMLLGGQDALIPPPHVAAIRQAIANAPALAEQAQVVVYPEAGHGFFCEARSDFHPASATDGWQRILDFLKT